MKLLKAPSDSNSGVKLICLTPHYSYDRYHSLVSSASGSLVSVLSEASDGSLLSG